MRTLVAAGALVYVLFAVSCFRLAVVYVDDDGLSVAEGLFTLLGGIALIASLFVRRRRALLVFAGTLPLVGWFAATPYNSGPPFLVASLVAPVTAALSGAVRSLRAG